MTNWFSGIEPNRAVPEWDEDARKWLQTQLEKILAELEASVRTVHLNQQSSVTVGTSLEILDSCILPTIAVQGNYSIRLLAQGAFAATVDGKQVRLTIGASEFVAPTNTDPTDNVWRIDATISLNQVFGVYSTEYGAQAFHFNLSGDPVLIAIRGLTAVAGELTLDLFKVDYQRNVS